MDLYNRIICIQIALVSPGLCLHHNKTPASFIRANEGVITPTEIRVDGFVVQWDPDDFEGSGDFTVKVLEALDNCEVQFPCVVSPCTINSDDDPLIDCGIDMLDPCSPITVIVTRGTMDPEPSLTINLAPGIANSGIKLALTDKQATLSWTAPPSNPSRNCATRVWVTLEVASGWSNSIEMTASLGATNSYDWTLPDCEHGELFASGVYLTLVDGYDTTETFTAEGSEPYKGQGVTPGTVKAAPSSQCSLAVDWDVTCDGAHHYTVTIDGKDPFDVTDAPSTPIGDLAAGDHVVSVQAYWSEGQEELMGDTIDSEPANVEVVAPDVPSEVSVVGNDTAPKTLTVTWEAPTTLTCAGEVTGYTISCGDGPYMNDTGVMSPYILTCPEACTKYDLFVAATWSGGNGVFRKSSGTTGSQAPEKPTDIAGDTDATSIALSWTLSDTANSCLLSGHTVTWAPDDGDDSGGPHELGGDAVSDTITGLTCNKKYTVTVKATAEGGKSNSGNKDIATEDKAPETEPGNIGCNEVDDPTKLSVNWEKVKSLCDGDLKGYMVSWEVDGKPLSHETDNTATSYKVPDLKPCTEYSVNVAAISQKGLVGPSGTATGSTGIDVPGKPDPSIEPESSTASTLLVSWTQRKINDCAITNYKVEWSSENGGSDSGLIDGTKDNYDITGLICNTNYSIIVTAYTADTKFIKSTAIQGITDDQAPEATTITQVSPPDDDDSTKLTVEWSPPTYGCTGSSLGDYSVTWTTGVDDDPSNNADVTDTPYTIGGLVPCTTYSVTVAARSETGLFGDPGTGTTNTTVAVPGISTDITRKTYTPESLEVTWSPPPTTISEGGNSCDITKYTVEWSNSNAGTEQGSDETTKPSLNITGLAACTDYDIKVTAYTVKGAGDPSETKNFTTGVDAPPVGESNVTIDATSRDAEVTWDRPDTLCELEFNVTHSGKTKWNNNQTTDLGYSQAIADPKHDASLHHLLPYSDYDVCITILNGGTTCKQFTTEEDIPSAPRNVSVFGDSITDVSLTLNWEFPEEENGKLLNYVVSWGLEGESWTNGTVDTDTTSLTIDELKEGNHIFTVIAVNSKGSSPSSEYIEQNMNGASSLGGGAIAGIVIGVLLVALVIPAFIFRDRIMKKIKSGSSSSKGSGYELKGAAILKSEFRRQVTDLESDGAKAAYQKLINESPHKDTFAASKPFNKDKNRYDHIYPFNETRVKLQLLGSGPKGSDYINANHVTFPEMSTLRFIATQGPLDNTISDFWRMVWEQNVYDVVMLCNLVEEGENKCAKYWSDKGNNSMEFGDFIISCQAEEVDKRNQTITRYIDLVKNGQRRIVKQHHYVAWPDNGVPDNVDDMLKFLASIKGKLITNGKHIVVHGSAGVGRTGTLIGLWALTNILEENKSSKSIDVHMTALRMRECRQDMVQTEDQYLYLQKCLLKYMKDTENSFPISNKDKEEPIYGNVNTGYQQ